MERLLRHIELDHVCIQTNPVNFYFAVGGINNRAGISLSICMDMDSLSFCFWASTEESRIETPD